MKWVIGDGLDTKLLLDPWLEGGLILAQVAIGTIPHINLEKYADQDGSWK